MAMDSGAVTEATRSRELADVPEPDYSDAEECENLETKNLSCSVSDDLNSSSDQLDVEVSSSEPPADDGEQNVPIPDYPDGEDEVGTEHALEDRIEPIKLAPESLDSRLTANGDDSELIAPKKLVNPCLLSREHKALRQELKMNHKIGKNVTEKPELIKVLKERQEKEKKKELEEHQKAKRTSFDIRLEEQANKISQAEHQKLQEAEQIKKEEEKPEFFKMHSKIIKTKLDT